MQKPTLHKTGPGFFETVRQANSVLGRVFLRRGMRVRGTFGNAWFYHVGRAMQLRRCQRRMMRPVPQTESLYPKGTGEGTCLSDERAGADA